MHIESGSIVWSSASEGVSSRGGRPLRFGSAKPSSPSAGADFFLFGARGLRLGLAASSPF